MFCHNCGTQVHEDAIFCPECGEKLIADEIAQKSIPQNYAIDTVQREATQQVKTKRASPKAIVLFCILAVAIVVALLLVCVRFRGGDQVKDESAAYNILDDWITEHDPISKMDTEYHFDFAGTGSCPNETINGEKYFVEAVTVSYNNKDYYLYRFQYHLDIGPSKNDIITGYVYIKAADGSMYVSFSDSMKPIDSWYETFDDWVVTVADPEIYKTFTTKGPATLDDAMEIFEEWETTHPLDPNLTVRPGYDDVENDAFTLFLWGYEAELGTIYVDKTDGSMKMVSDFIEYDLDDWYNGVPGENTYNSGDECYINGNFEWVEFPNIRTDYLYGTAVASYIEGVVRNVSGSTKSPTITFILYDSNWNQVGTAVDITSHLADGATWKFSAYYPSDAAYYEFYEIN